MEDTNEKGTAGERIADGVVSNMGSWRFVIAQSVIVVCWIASNLWLLSRPWDPYPFILLNLAFSTQAAYASPLILMAGNRAAARDRAREDRRQQADAAQLARIEALEKKIDKHVIETSDIQRTERADMRRLIDEIHAAIPDTGCAKHGAKLVCADCLGERE